MNRLLLSLSLFGAASLFLPHFGGAAARAAENGDAFWPQWRGPLATGVAPLADPPLTWSDTSGIRWKAKVPGSGTSTPVIWGNNLFLLTAIPTGQKAEDAPAANPGPGDGGPRPGGRRAEAPTQTFQFVVLCYDRNTGKELWRKVAVEKVPHEAHHPDHGYASASPVTDGQSVWAYFGSRGLHCYGVDGTPKWSKEFGQMKTRNSFGEGSSPAVHGNTIVVYWDDETENDFITALDKRTGKELWRVPRNEPTGWSTPLIVEHEGKAQVIVNATGKVRSYDLKDGKELWSCAGQTGNAIPTPVATLDTVYVTSGFRGSALYAIALGQTGDLAGGPAVRWTRDKYTPYVPSPLLADDSIYLVSGNTGMLSCFDAKTGSPHFEAERLESISGIYASPVAAKDRVYVLGRNGTCLVLKRGPKLEILATNKLDDKTDASIALVGKELFIRGREQLYCIGGL
jgi:outer membrane protein assembly factor BamB